MKLENNNEYFQFYSSEYFDCWNENCKYKIVL